MVYDSKHGCDRGRPELDARAPADLEDLKNELKFSELREANLARLPSFGQSHITSWSGPQWGNALAGEVGEACNVVKKIDRRLDSDPNYNEAIKELELEIADVVCYADLLAARYNIDLGEAVRKKFNLVSERRRSDVRL